MSATSEVQHEPIVLEARSHLWQGVCLLLQGFDYARELNRDVWDFAVELSTLRAAGMTRNDVRWMIYQGFVEHAREVSLPGEIHRDFHHGGQIVFRRDTCLALTPRGAVALRSLSSGPAERVGGQNGEVSAAAAPEPVARRVVAAEHASSEVVPQWDAMRLELRFGDLLVKQFKLPSPNQETILMAFQEERWPPRIDDPLPPRADVDPKRRLNDTIKSLNRNQKDRCVRFMGDGTGRGIRWEQA